MGDAWLAVQSQLLSQGIKPIAPDARTLERHVTLCMAQAAEVQQKQSMLKQQCLQEQSEQERELLNSILHQRDQEVINCPMRMPSKVVVVQSRSSPC